MKNDLKKMNTKLKGVTFNDRQNNVKKLKSGFKLFWIHEEDNPYDENAILCFADPNHEREVGHLSKEVAKDFVKRKEEGYEQQIYVSEVTGKDPNHSYGVNVKIIEWKEDDDEEERESE